MRTDLDFGPSVMLTASASCVVPRRTFSRALERKRTCFAVIASAFQIPTCVLRFGNHLNMGATGLPYALAATTDSTPENHHVDGRGRSVRRRGPVSADDLLTRLRALLCA